MALRGRPKLKTPTVAWKLHVPIDLAARLDLLCLDPARGILSYGARSALVSQLIREYLDSKGTPNV